MTETEKLNRLIATLKEFAEAKHCLDVYGDNHNLKGSCGDAFDEGMEYGEINFARTLLEQIGEDFKYPCMKEND